LPPNRPATFAADLAVKNIGGEPRDFVEGSQPQVGELEVSKRVFSVHSDRFLSARSHSADVVKYAFGLAIVVPAWRAR
jgi:hypothetical protein